MKQQLTFILLLIPFVVCGQFHIVGVDARSITRPAPSLYIDSIWKMDFEDVDSLHTQYIDSEIDADFAFGGDVPTDLNWIHGGGQHKPGDYNISVVAVNPISDGSGGTTQAMKFTMDDGEFDLSGAQNPTDDGGGGRIYSPANTQRDTIIASYNALIAPGADFVRHGKFPAIQGGIYETWQVAPVDGFSTTFTWLGDDGSCSTCEGAIEAYCVGALGPDTTSGRNGTYIFGPSLDASDTTFLDVTDSTWINFTIVVFMSDASTNNGSMVWYYNGQVVCKRTNICTRLTSGGYQDQFGISWFYGGSSSEFATTQDESILLDDFWICCPNSTNGIGVTSNPSSGHKLNYLPGYDITNQRRWDYGQ